MPNWVELSSDDLIKVSEQRVVDGEVFQVNL